MQPKGRRTFGDFPPPQKAGYIGWLVLLVVFFIAAMINPLSPLTVVLLIALGLAYVGLKRWIDRTVPRR